MERKTESKILTIKGQRVILDSDLAQLYGVSTTRLNEQVSGIDENSTRSGPRPHVR